MLKILAIISFEKSTIVTRLNHLNHPEKKVVPEFYQFANIILLLLYKTEDVKFRQILCAYTDRSKKSALVTLLNFEIVLHLLKIEEGIHHRFFIILK